MRRVVMKDGAVARLREKGAAKRATETLQIGGVEFVLVPKADRPKQAARGAGSASTVGEARGRVSGTGRRLFDARRHAGLTQTDLAKRLGKSQAFVSMAESGRAVVGDRYVQAVLAACGFPPTWGAPKPHKLRKRHDELEASEIAGFDPETLQAVRKGSRRDKQLAKQYVWWKNY
jgi:transcriptional regulator with XRE-family HTH domain